MSALYMKTLEYFIVADNVTSP